MVDKMSEFTEYIGRQFGDPHGFVGKICGIIMNVINKRMYLKVVDEVTVKDGEKVLDIGYGNGYLLQKLCKRTKAELYGIDISEDMKTQAEKRCKKAKADGKLFLRVGDCCDLPYDDEMFSVVTSVNTVYFWSDTVKGLSEIRRTLRTGGSFYNIVYTKEFLDSLIYTKKGFKKFSPEELTELGIQAGFENIEVKDIVKRKSFAVIYTK